MKKIHNDKLRYTAKCGDLEGKCEWRIHTSLMADGCTFRVTTLKVAHICQRQKRHKNAAITSRWVQEKIRQKVKIDPAISYELLQDELEKDWVSIPCIQDV